MRIPFITLIAGSALALGGCAYGGLGIGPWLRRRLRTLRLLWQPYYGAGYGSARRYGGYGAYYGGYGYGSPYYGWYDDYYYPGTGYYVYDSYRRPHAMTRPQRSILDKRRRRLATTSDHHEHHDEAQLERLQPPPAADRVRRQQVETPGPTQHAPPQ